MAEQSVEEHHFYFAEGRCEGKVTGAFRAAHHPRRRSDGPFLMSIQGLIQTDDGAVIMTDDQGYGTPYPRGRRPVVGAVCQITEDSRCS